MKVVQFLRIMARLGSIVMESRGSYDRGREGLYMEHGF